MRPFIFNGFKKMCLSAAESLLHVRQLRMCRTLEVLISIHPVLRDKVWPGHAAYSVYWCHPMGKEASQ